MEFLDELLNSFELKYEPATSVDESDAQLSSNEIIGFYESTDVEFEDLYEGLSHRGFVNKFMEDKFLWLVKEKSPN